MSNKVLNRSIMDLANGSNENTLNSYKSYNPELMISDKGLVWCLVECSLEALQQFHSFLAYRTCGICSSSISSMKISSLSRISAESFISITRNMMWWKNMQYFSRDLFSALKQKLSSFTFLSLVFLSFFYVLRQLRFLQV